MEVPTVDCSPAFLQTIVTNEETWVYAYDRKPKMRSSEWQQCRIPRPTKSRPVKTKTEAKLIAFFDNESFVYHEFVTSLKTVYIPLL
ncbi:hypothetical protein TNCT_576131 [Trichonephila clavata]|uniref:Uncharacterized protein n=1 Tax=Trichonephila clavata TaxID=2740835 RepID=A0A8X6LQ40_TRICU|nr:hypothetical protein TNCT_576131 [Trichonephila clavata]